MEALSSLVYVMKIAFVFSHVLHLAAKNIMCIFRKGSCRLWNQFCTMLVSGIDVHFYCDIFERAAEVQKNSANKQTKAFSPPHKETTCLLSP